MESRHASSAEHARRRIDDGAHDPATFRAALLAVPRVARDAWVDHVLELGALPDDGPELPRGCVPYVPCDVGALLEVIDRAAIGPSDVFVDLGSGVGRATALVHLLTGATAIGIEIQPELVRLAGALARPRSPRVSCLVGDAAELVGQLPTGSVFFLYCPFGGDRLDRVLAALEVIARTRPIRVCCVDLPMRARAWLVAEPAGSERIAIYRSVR